MMEGPMVEDLDRQNCLALLGQLRWGHLALTLDAMPAIRSVRFLLDEGDIRFWVAKGSRLQRAVSGAVVAFHAEKIDEPAGEATSVQVRGIAKPVGGYGGGPTLARRGLPPWSGAPKADELLQISTDDITGQRVRWLAG